MLEEDNAKPPIKEILKPFFSINLAVSGSWHDGRL